LSFLI